jgi:hypothetical protein
MSSHKRQGHSLLLLSPLHEVNPYQKLSDTVGLITLLTVSNENIPMAIINVTNLKLQATYDTLTHTFSTASDWRARDALGCSEFRTLLLETGFGTPSRSFTEGRGGGTFSCLPCNIISNKFH